MKILNAASLNSLIQGFRWNFRIVNIYHQAPLVIKPTNMDTRHPGAPIFDEHKKFWIKSHRKIKIKINCPHAIARKYLEGMEYHGTRTLLVTNIQNVFVFIFFWGFCFCCLVIINHHHHFSSLFSN